MLPRHILTTVVLLGASVFCSGIAQAVTLEDRALGQKIPSFKAELIDVSVDPPKTEPYESATSGKVTAFIFVGTRCATTADYAERFRDTAATYSPRGVDFIYLYPNREDTREEKISFHKSRQLGGRLIDDQGGALARQFPAARTTEIFLADKTGTVVYHGGLDDNRSAGSVKQRHLANAIDAVLSGKPVAVGFSQVFA